jgi:prepilin-type processing-associated H-X9-DG protein
MYHCASDRRSDKLHTSYVMVVGANTASAGATSTRCKDFSDGLSCTVVLAEMSRSGIHWMEPRDASYDDLSGSRNASQRRVLRSEHSGTFNAAFADGHAAAIRADIDPEVLKSLFTISGGEKTSGLYDDY